MGCEFKRARRSCLLEELVFLVRRRFVRARRMGHDQRGTSDP